MKPWIEPLVAGAQLASAFYDTGLLLVVKNYYNGTNSSSAHSSEEAQQKAISDFYIIYHLVDGLTPLLSAYGLARLGDRINRKISIGVPLAGYLLSRFLLLLLILLAWPIEVMYGAAVLHGLTGGFTTYWASIMALASQGSSESRRSLRFISIELIYGIAGFVGSIASGHLFVTFHLGYQHGIVLISCSVPLYALCVIYSLFVLQVPNAGVCDLATSTNVIQPDSSLADEENVQFHRCECSPNLRPARSIIAMLFVGAMLYDLAVVGAMNVLPLFFLKKPLSWGPEYVGYANAAGHLIFITSFLGVFVFSKFLRDTTMIMIGIVSFSAGILIMAFVRWTFLFYIARGVMLFALIPLPTIRSLLSKHVEASVYGKVFVLLQLSLVITGVVTTTAYNKIYQQTLGWFSGFCFLLSCVIGCLTLIPIRLERLRIFIQNRNANVGTPEEGNNCNLDRRPATSSGSATQGGQRLGSRQRSPARGLEKSPPRSRAFHFCRANRDNSISDGEKVRTFWTCCSNCKISPQGFKPQAEKQQTKPCSKSERIENYSKQAHNSFAISLATESTNTRRSDTTISTTDTMDSTCLSFISAESEQGNNMLDVEAIVTLMEYAHRHDKQFLDNHEENIGFLRAISANCVAAQKCGQDTLDLPYTKNQLTEALVMVMETLPSQSVPSFVLSCSMLAVYNLSKMKPPLASELETGILRLALHGIFSMETQTTDVHSVALYRSSFDTMDIMLKGLLSETPTISHLLFILEHVNFWIRSQDPQERFRAINCSISLLRHVNQQSNFEKTGELSGLGHQVAQFAVCITDSVEEVSYQARGAISCLYQLLLNHMGLSTTELGELWCQETEDKKMLAYLDACRVGELFRNIFTEGQKRAFLQTSLLAMYDPLMRISQAGILLVYSLLGKTAELMRESAEDVEKEIYKQLHKLRILREVPEALQSFLLN